MHTYVLHIILSSQLYSVHMQKIIYGSKIAHIIIMCMHYYAARVVCIKLWPLTVMVSS